MNPMTRTSLTNWTLRGPGLQRPLAAKVPGTVHETLLSARLKPDPFWREAELEWQAVDREDWVYETTLPVSVVGVGQRELVCEGLDTICEVRVDGKWLATTDNMHRTWRFPLPAGPGGETLTLTFRSPVAEGLKRLDALGFPLNAINDQSERGGLGDKKVSPFLRKAGYHFGWDWGPRLVTSGPWRPVVVETWHQVRIDDLFVRTVAIGEGKAHLEVTVTLQAVSAGPVQLRLSLTPETVIVRDLDLSEGQSSFVFHLTIDNPQLWWCRGQGESFLYTGQLELLRHGEVLATKTTVFGIRTIELRRAADEFGESFEFVLNGRAVFAKGANWIPNDSLLPRITPAHLEKIVRAAADVNMNMLRVWGGGIFEDDQFYDLCDQLGILVWQDFLFACAMYPGDPAFLASVKAEAEDNIVRIRKHPCLALWCGNNEIDSAWWRSEEGKGWGWKEKHTAAERTIQETAYDAIFHNVLPEVVARLHPGAAYWPSSPWPGPNRGHVGFSAIHGDVHYWGVWHQREPFERFDEVLPRFMSEYGFQSFPDPWALRQFTLPDDRQLESSVMKAHQRSGNGNALIRAYLEDWSLVPQDFDRFVLASQILQARGIRRAVEAHRRNRPRVMGTLYWQLNDCWPAASWSSLDWKGRWKALHYAIRRAFAPLLLSAIEGADGLEIWAVNDDPVPREGTLTGQWWSLDGALIAETAWNVEMPPASSRRIAVDRKRGDVASFAWNGVEAKTIWWNTKPKDRRVVTGGLSAVWKRAATGWSVGVSSPVPVETIALWTDRAGGVAYSDNFFFLLPGEIQTINVSGPDAVSLVPEDFHVESDAWWGADPLP